MSLENRFSPLMRIGLVFLILASLSNWLLHRVKGLSPDLADGTTGLLFGLAIGCMLLGIWRNRRRPVA